MPKLLVANRSEIAIRVFRAATELGLQTVAIYAAEDRFGTHRFKADEAYELDSSKGPVGAYLDIEGVISIAKRVGADLIHPGYGFMSENAAFARACEENGIVFVGPRPQLLQMMGDKVAARAQAQKVGVRVLPGTQDAISDRDQALKTANEIGFPLIIKAAAGGGGRGMRVVLQSEKLNELLDEAQGEALRAFGDSSVFLERYVPRAKHIEVQILGDKHGNCYHLYERDCSVQRRHQKVIEIAPSVNLDENMRAELCEAAQKLASSIGYDNAGTVEFLVDVDAREWFFIEMNPRIQVEHTVTEQITGIDLVRSQILIAQGHALTSPEVGLPPQNAIARNGYAIQARITTEDPEKGFAPDYGKILAYRSAAGFGIRLDGGMAASGAVVTPFYDSLLVKVTASAPTFETAIHRLDRALREFRIRGVKTNIPFIENVLHHPTFSSGNATTTLIDTTPELFEFKPRRDRATKLLRFLGDVIVNGNPNAKGWKPQKPFAEFKLPKSTCDATRSPVWTQLGLDAATLQSLDHAAPENLGTRQILHALGPRKFADWTKNQTALLVTDTTLRDAHQSLLATRVRTYDMLRVAAALQSRVPNLFSLEMWGGATFDTAMRFGREDPWERLRLLREAIPNICFQMLFRGSNAVGYSNYPDNVVAGFVKHAADSGMDIFRVFDSLNYLPNLRVAMDAIGETGTTICEAAICYTGDILDPKREKYPLDYYVSLAKELERMGAHFLAIKDMAGLCRPYAAHRLVSVLKEEIGLPIHFHTHDTSGINAASVLQASDAGVDIVDLALASMSGGTSQPNLNSVVAALQNTPRDTQLDVTALNELSDYWESVLPFYKPFDTTSRAGTAEVYLHEMPGGQYTNLKEQASAMGLANRWSEIAQTYAEVNALFGDIVKVTPSSKVVGDLTMLLVTRGLKASDVRHLEPGSLSFPESVIDMLRGGLGQPRGGFPQDVQRVVLNGLEPLSGRPGEDLLPLDLEKKRTELGGVCDDDLWSHLMYPQVHTEFAAFKDQFGDVSVLPTPAYFYGLQPGEEISVSIEAGKTLIVKLINVGEANANGQRSVNFELNGIARSVSVDDKSLAGEKKTRLKADSSQAGEVGAPIPGMVTSIAVSTGAKVEKGEKLLTLEAMKMLTQVNAPVSGKVEEICVSVGETVEAKDLMVRIGE